MQQVRPICYILLCSDVTPGKPPTVSKLDAARFYNSYKNNINNFSNFEHYRFNTLRANTKSNNSILTH